MGDAVQMCLFKLKDNEECEKFKLSPFYKGADAVYCEWYNDGEIIFHMVNHKMNWQNILKIRIKEVEVIEMIPIPSAIERVKKLYKQ